MYSLHIILQVYILQYKLLSYNDLDSKNRKVDKESHKDFLFATVGMKQHMVQKVFILYFIK